MITIISVSLLCIAAYYKSQTENNRFVDWAFSVLTVIYFIILSAHFIANEFTGKGIDESVLYHLKSGFEGAGYANYFELLFYTLSATIIGIVILHALGKRNKTKKILDGSIWFLVSIILLSFALNPTIISLGGLVLNYYNNVDESKPNEYVNNLSYNIQNKKNIIILYLESGEDTYLDNNIFPGLMNDLNAVLDDSARYTGIRSLYGSGWTIAGMVASQCGTPLIPFGGGNDMDGMSSFYVRANCLTDILAKDGYKTVYIGGAQNKFAGKGLFYKTHLTEEIIGYEELSKRIRMGMNGWGIGDDDLLNLMYEKYKDLSKKNKPFALIGLTLDTHHPHGALNNSCKKRIYLDGSNKMLNAIYCNQETVAKFINKIRNDENFKDTILVVLSDHLSMKNDVYDKLNTSKRSNLLSFFSAEISPGLVEVNGSTFDVAPTILGYLKASQTELGFGKDLRSGSKTFAEIYGDNSNQKIIASEKYLKTLWNENESQGFNNFAKFNNNRLQIFGANLSAPVYLEYNDGKISDIAFGRDNKKIAKIIYSDNLKYKKLFFDKCINLNKYIGFYEKKVGMCYLIYDYSQNKYMYEEINNEQHVNLSDIDLTSSPKVNAFDFDRFVNGKAIDHKVTEHSESKGNYVYYINSVGNYNKTSTIVDIKNSLTEGMKRGINVFGIDRKHNIERLATIDTCDTGLQNSKLSKNALTDILNSSSLNYEYTLVVGHDSIVCEDKLGESILKNTKIKTLDAPKAGSPYIAILKSNKVLFEKYGVVHGEELVKFEILEKNNLN